jgi:hypothetical protein
MLRCSTGGPFFLQRSLAQRSVPAISCLTKIPMLSWLGPSLFRRLTMGHRETYTNTLQLGQSSKERS